MKQLGNFLLAAAVVAALAGVVCVSARAAEPVVAVALVTRDAVTLRAAPRDSAAAQTVLWHGEVMEIRAERGDFVQVWDHQRERGGYVKRSQLLRVGNGEKAAPELLALLGFVSEQPGSESFGSSEWESEFDGNKTARSLTRTGLFWWSLGESNS